MQLPGCKCTDTGILQLSTKSHVSSRFPECTAHPAALIRLWILHTDEHVTSGPRNEGEGEEVLPPQPRKSEIKQQRYTDMIFSTLSSSIFLHGLCGKYDRSAPFCGFNEAYVLFCEM